MDFIIDLNLPFSLVEAPSLRNLLMIVSRRKILLPTRKLFMKEMENSFDRMKTNLIKKIQTQKYVCMTCDVWSSRACSFLGITVHFIEEYKRKSFVLAFRQLKYKQTYYELATAIDSISTEFQIPREIITNLVTDGGSAFCKAFRVYGKSHDTLVESNITDEAGVEDPVHVEPSDTNERHIILENMPYMQQEDGEILFSNILTFGLLQLV